MDKQLQNLVYSTWHVTGVWATNVCSFGIYTTPLAQFLLAAIFDMLYRLHHKQIALTWTAERQATL